MHESAFDNLNSVYYSNNDNNSVISNESNNSSIYLNNETVYNDKKNESIFSFALKSDHLKNLKSDPFSNVFNSKNNISDTMFANNQDSINENKSIYLQNGKLDSDKDTKGVIDRSRSLNDVMNIDQSKMKSLQMRFTNTNSVEDLSVIGDNQSNLTLQERRTNTNSVEDNSIYNNESVMLAQEFHQMLIEEKNSNKKPQTNEEGSLALKEMLEQMEIKKDKSNQTQEEQTAAMISHSSNDASSKNITPKKNNRSSMTAEEETEEKGNIKAKQKIKRNKNNYNRNKYKNVNNEDDEMSASIQHETQKTTISDYLSKY